MSLNAYYNPSGAPGFDAPGTSATIRAEFVAIAAGFSLLPPLPLTPNTAVVVNSGGTGFTITGGLSLAGSFATTGNFTTTLAQVASVTLTLPAVNGTLATLAGAETFFNKTLVAPALGTPTSGDLSNCTGVAPGLTAGTVQTLPNLTGPITSAGTVTSIAAQTGSGSVIVVQTSPTLVTPVLGVATASSINGLLITTTSAAHLTIASSKTLTVSNSLTLAGTDSTVMTFPSTSDTVDTINATQTLTNKTLTAPIMTAPVLGTVASGNIAACTGFPGSTAGNATTFLTSNVSLNNISNFFDGPNTGSIGAAGQTWMIIGVCCIADGGINIGVESAIWNGSVYITDSGAVFDTSGTQATGVVTTIAIVTLSAATTFTLRAKSNSVTSAIAANAPGLATGVANKTTSITAVRIA